jgi:hypothetical protein
MQIINIYKFALSVNALSTFNPTAPEGQFKEAQFGVPHNINANLQLINAFV